MEYTMDQQIACVKREIAMRKNVYPKWCYSGSMTETKATHEIECMTAVLRTLEAQKDPNKALQATPWKGVDRPELSGRRA